MKPHERSVRDLHDEIQRRYGNSEDFVGRVLEALATYGITQADVARVSGYDRAILNRWLRRRTKPNLQSMLVIDEAVERLVEAEK